jgi:hypothetical protein
METINVKSLLGTTTSSQGVVSESELQTIINILTSKITELENNPIDSRPYKVYTAKIFQSGTNVPTATVMESTFTAPIIFTRSSVGSYRASCDEFPGTIQYATYISTATPRLIGPEVTYVSVEYNEFIQQVIIEVRALDDSAYIDGLAGILEIRVYN